MISISWYPGEAFVWPSPRQLVSLLLVRWSSLFFQWSSSIRILFCTSIYNFTFFFFFFFLQENNPQPIVLVVRGWDEASLVMNEHSWAPRKFFMWRVLHAGVHRTCTAFFSVNVGRCAVDSPWMKDCWGSWVFSATWLLPLHMSLGCRRKGEWVSSTPGSAQHAQMMNSQLIFSLWLSAPSCHGSFKKVPGSPGSRKRFTFKQECRCLYHWVLYLITITHCLNKVSFEIK